MLNLEEINEIINGIKHIYPQWTYISLYEYNELYLYLRWLSGEEEDRPKFVYLNSDKLRAVRESLNMFLINKYD